jgi:hypothetical protein
MTLKSIRTYTWTDMMKLRPSEYYKPNIFYDTQFGRNRIIYISDV